MGGSVIVQRYMCVRLSVCVCMCVRGAHMSKDACLFRRICQWNCVCVCVCVRFSVCEHCMDTHRLSSHKVRSEAHCYMITS